MAAPTKLDVIAELKALGIEASEDQKMPELLEMLKGAREGAGAGDATQPTAPAAPEASKGRGKKAQAEGTHVMLTNVNHDGVVYKKGAEVELDAATLEVFLTKGFVAE